MSLTPNSSSFDILQEMFPEYSSVNQNDEWTLLDFPQTSLIKPIFKAGYIY